jgi:large subunit ribosomal protein L19
MAKEALKNLNIISPVNVEDRQAINIGPGDTVRVWQKIEEKGKTRLQAFEGLVLARKHGNEAGATFTVRKVSGGVGIEKIFPLYSPAIDKIEIVRRAKVRRAKLYHIRDKAAREIRRQMRNMRIVDISTESDMENKAQVEKDSADAEAKVAEGDAKKAEEAEGETIAPAEAAEEAQGNSGAEEQSVEESKETKSSEPEENK